MKKIEQFYLDGLYKGLSVINLVINKVFKPATSNTFQKINELIIINDESNSDTITKIKKSIKNGIEITGQCVVTPWNFLGEIIDSKQEELEIKLKQEFNVNLNHWYFSRENVSLIERIIVMVNFASNDISHLSTYRSLKYLICYTILQKIVRSHNPDILFKNLKSPFEEEKNEIDKSNFDYLNELEQIKIECSEICKFAHGCYGDLLNYVYSGKNVIKALNITNYDQEFINHTKIDKKDLLYSSWESTPYIPAYCITINKEKKQILLCLRGSLNWADFVTDLVFTYLSFSILKNDNKDKYIKINYNLMFGEEIGSAIQDTLNLNTKPIPKQKNLDYLNNPLDKLKRKQSKPKEKYKELYRGLAHSGIFLAGIELFRKIAPKLEKLFENLNDNDYKLIVTGHSLGGGMTIMMILLLLVHPLKYFEGKNIREKIKGFAFGSPPLFSKEIINFMDGVLINVVNQYDLVPRLSFGSVKDIIRIILAFEELDKTDNELIKTIMHFKEKDEYAAEKVKIFLEMYKNLKIEQMKTIKLVHVGRSFLISQKKINENDKEKSIYSFQEIKNINYFHDLIFSKKMIKYHFPHLYEEGLLSEIEFLPLFE